MPVWFSEDAGRRIVEAVRYIESRIRNLELKQKSGIRLGDNELIIDGVADGACALNAVGQMTPNLDPTDNIYYYNTLGAVVDGSRIVIGYSHRSGQASARNHSGKPTPYILISDGCDA